MFPLIPLAWYALTAATSFTIGCFAGYHYRGSENKQTVVKKIVTTEEVVVDQVEEVETPTHKVKRTTANA